MPNHVHLFAVPTEGDSLARLLRADGNPIRHGTSENMRHGIRIVCGIQSQPDLFGIVLPQA